MSIKNTVTASAQLCSVKDRCANLYKSAKLTDCKFLVGNSCDKEIISAHKLVLAMTSPVLECMFYGSLKQDDTVIEIDDIRPDTFKILLDYIYMDEMTVKSLEDAMELYYAAEKYMLDDLLAKLMGAFKEFLNINNVCVAYEFAELYDVKILKEDSLRFISQNIRSVLNSSAFYDVSHKTFLDILRIPQCERMPDIVFTILDAYVKKRCLNNAKNTNDDSKDAGLVENYDQIFIADAIELINFMDITPKRFIEITRNTKILSRDQCYDILVDLIINYCNY